MRRYLGWLGLTLALTTLSGCAIGPAATPEPLPPDQRVFAYYPGDNGWTGQLARTMSGPVLVVYGDGRVFRLAENQSAEMPPAYAVARVDPMAVARFAVAAEERNVVNDTTDFGDNAVTDQGTTTVVLYGPSGRTVADVYAFERRFEDGLTRAQRRNRSELRQIVASAFALADDAPRSDFTPDQVRVVELSYSESGPSAGAEWPGPDLAGFLEPSSVPYRGLACGTLSGADAARAYAAARHNPGGIWTVDGQTRVLVVVPMLPGQLGCPR